MSPPHSMVLHENLELPGQVHTAAVCPASSPPSLSDTIDQASNRDLTGPMSILSSRLDSC